MKSVEMQSKLRLMASLCIFGTISLFVRNIALGSGLIALWREACSERCFLLLFLAVRRRKNRISPPSGKTSAFCCSPAASWGSTGRCCLKRTKRYTTVAVATLCYYMQPVFLTLAAAVLLGEKLSVKKGICILAALCGMVLISGVIGGGIPEARELTGIALGLGAACLYAGVILCNRKSSRRSAPTIKRLSSCSLRRS